MALALTELDDVALRLMHGEADGEKEADGDGDAERSLEEDAEPDMVREGGADPLAVSNSEEGGEADEHHDQLRAADSVAPELALKGALPVRPGDGVATALKGALPVRPGDGVATADGDSRVDHVAESEKTVGVSREENVSDLVVDGVRDGVPEHVAE